MTMGQLVRARSPEDKAGRRQSLIRVAAELFEHSSFDEITMAQVAIKARIAKGTTFLYFPTKEALFLELFEQRLDEWLTVLHDAVSQDERPWPSARLARIIADTLLERPSLARLLPLASTLEANVAAERVAAFRHKLMRRLFGTGSLVESRLGLARAGDGVQLLHYAIAMIIGLRLPVDPAADLRTGLTVLFNGFHRKA
jgi:AcrR family transcriptional regulator